MVDCNTEMEPMERDDLIANTFVRIVDSLVDEFDIIDMLTGLAVGCVDLDLATACGILLVDENGLLRVMAASNERTHLLELFQLQNDEGPCRDCYRSGVPVSVPDLAQEADRWPRFAPVATRAGFRAAHAIPMRLRGKVLGTLNLFRTEPVALSPAAASTAQALADIATISLLQSRALRDIQTVAEQLDAALNSRVAIEQAKGVLAERLGVDMDVAFSRLRQYARAHRSRLTDVARDVVEGTLRVEEFTGVQS